MERNTQGCPSRIKIAMPSSTFRILATFFAAAIGSLLIAGTLCEPRDRAVYASAKTDRAAGLALFHEKGCEHCHGVEGVGGEKGPSLAGVGRKRTPAEIETQILHGGDAMPPFVDVLAPGDVTFLVEYLSAKKKVSKDKRPSSASAKPPAVPASGGSDDQ